jgi:hypothetical protein
MCNIKSVIWHLIVLTLVVTLSILFRDDLRFTELSPFLSILQNTSAMVFTIMGIWIAYLYPNAIMKITQPSRVEVVFSDEDEARISLIVGVVALSALVMCSLIIGAIAVPILKSSYLYEVYPSIIRGIGLFLILVIGYVQLFAVYIVFASNLDFIVKLRNLKKKQRMKQRLNPKMDSMKDNEC